ncbi:hypothetical protein K474DRAFT_1674333 [Panus rudis PR-1116 ss-1]|nr:hypothetical protein K474DRAFT_1674333 [Panus rudis PR-1116 ss-1]
MFKSIVSLALLPVLVLASPQPQYGGYGPPAGGSSSSSSSAAAPAPSSVQVPADTAGHHNIVVGGSGLSFSPANVSANVGDLVTFWFTSSIPHSVTQSTFADPCTPLTGSNGTGFDSGLTTGTQFTINVTDASKPIWFFCKFPGHCGAGMVGSINAPSSGNTFDAFMSKAVGIGSSEPSISDSGPVTGGVGALATAGPVSVAASGSGSGAAPSPSSSGNTGGSSGSGAGRVVVSSGLGLIAAVAALAFVV